jgi:hypothetical protein
MYAALRENWKPFPKVCGFKTGNKRDGHSPKGCGHTIVKQLQFFSISLFNSEFDVFH